MSDMVNRPAHYCEGRKHEPLEVISDWDLNYRLGSALKYISRAGRKDPSKTVEDLKKSIFYLEREIAALEGAQTPYSVTYDDVLEDYAASAAQGEELVLEYGVQDVDGQPLGHWEADENDWLNFWDSDDDYMWDPSLGPIELSPEEVQELLAKKDLDQFHDDEIVSTVERRGMILGFKKDGSSCLLRNGKCA
ncbi:SaV protein [Synechococcus phage S-CRES1]|nr:SaV protein [Synechococcus phage S-CRES1]